MKIDGHKGDSGDMARGYRRPLPGQMQFFNSTKNGKEIPDKKKTATQNIIPSILS